MNNSVEIKDNIAVEIVDSFKSKFATCLFNFLDMGESIPF
jgi:hypothetical protein